MFPRVSVIVAAFNARDYIEAAVASALSQTENNVEVLVVDDGSTDGTKDIVCNISDSRLRLFVLEVNRGQGHARNVAMAEARGDWITFLDADDWCASNRFEVLLKVAEDYHVDIVADDIYRIADPADPHPPTKLAKHHFSHPEIIDAAGFLRLDSGLKPIMRREFLLRHSIMFDERLRYGEDTLLLLECFLAGAHLVLYPEPFYYYRERQGSLTTFRVETLIQRCKTTRELLERKMIQSDTILSEILHNRLNIAEAGLQYYRVVEPLRKGRLVEAFRAGLFSPSFLYLLIKSTPRVLNNRIFRYVRAHT